MKYDYLHEEKRKGDLYTLYQSLGWRQYLNIDDITLKKAMQNSFYVIYVYKGNKLIGTGRIISDGIINAYVCGIGVNSDYRNLGIGSKILNKLVAKCEESKLHTQLFCEEDLKTYYESKGFRKFAEGMRK